jgi:hypothetical protein
MTRDNGPQEVLWMGSRRITGARMFVMPELRPIRFRPGALGIDRPDQELLVSPEHRMLVKGAAAQALFNTPEVLVPARDLVNDRTVFTDLKVREVTYVHLLLARSRGDLGQRGRGRKLPPGQRGAERAGRRRPRPPAGPRAGGAS